MSPVIDTPRPSYRCESCDGLGWQNCGWAAPPSYNGVTFDVALVDWRRCARCNQTGIYVPRQPEKTKR